MGLYELKARLLIEGEKRVFINCVMSRHLERSERSPKS